MYIYTSIHRYIEETNQFCKREQLYHAGWGLWGIPFYSYLLSTTQIPTVKVPPVESCGGLFSKNRIWWFVWFHPAAQSDISEQQWVTGFHCVWSVVGWLIVYQLSILSLSCSQYSQTICWRGWDDNACLGVRNTCSIGAWPNSLDRRPPWYCIVSPLLQTNKQYSKKNTISTDNGFILKKIKKYLRKIAAKSQVVSKFFCLFVTEKILYSITVVSDQGS